MSKITGTVVLLVIAIAMVLSSVDGVPISERVTARVVGGTETDTCKVTQERACNMNGASSDTRCLDQKILPGVPCSDWYCIYEAHSGNYHVSKECKGPHVDWQWCWAGSSTSCTKTILICGLDGVCGRQPVTYNGKDFEEAVVSDAEKCGTRLTCYETWGWY
jgi:hypothetical protein